MDVDPAVECLPKCDRHGIRFLTDGPFAGGTELMFWTDRVGVPSSTPQLAEPQKVKAQAKVYDEAGHVMEQWDFELMPLERVDIGGMLPDQPFGWLDIVTDEDSFITGHFSATDRYSASLHAYCLPEEVQPAGPGIRIDKLTNGAAADVPPGPNIPVGGKVEWSYEVTNTGDTKLDGIVVTDSDGVTVSCPGDHLEPGESMTCTASGVAVACQHSNRAFADATPPTGGPVSDSDLSHYYGEERGALSLEAMINGEDADSPPGPELVVGADMGWTYEVANTGEHTLSGVRVTDQHGSAVTCPAATLAPGQKMTCAAGGKAALGQHTFTATATGKPECGPQVSGNDPTHYYCPAPQPGIAIEKMVNSQEADTPPGPKLIKNSTVAWTYAVTNIGGTVLSSIGVTDSQGVPVTCPKTTLQPAESMICTASGKAVTGEYCNVGVAAGKGPGNVEVSAGDPACYFGIWPDVQIEKLTNGLDADTPKGPDIQVGAAVQWSYVVTNTGDVQLTDVAVTDSRGVTVTCPKTRLPAGESMTCTASGTAAPGQYSNLGTVTAKAADSPDLTASDPSHYYGAAVGNQGCTPGYWKNHTDSWPPTGYTTQQAVLTVFSEAWRYPAQGQSALHQALGFGGGPGVEGAAEILLRAAVAAALNAAHPGVAYPRLAGEVIADVNDALLSGNRDTMLALAAALDADNNRGCPLS